MNENTNEGAEDKDSMKEQENINEKIDQEKEQQTKIIAEDNLEKNEIESDEDNTEKNEIESDEDNIDTLKKKLFENKDKLLRALAESENTRKQIEKIRIETNKYGVQPLAREILNVVDNFNRALNLKDDNKEKGLEEGLTLIQKEILSILEKFNVRKINALGEDFNANYHQAMFEKETSEFDEGKICEIVQDGYTFHERLLRPVLVGVAKKSNENSNDKKIEDGDNKKNEEKD